MVSSRSFFVVTISGSFFVVTSSGSFFRVDHFRIFFHGDHFRFFFRGGHSLAYFVNIHEREGALSWTVIRQLIDKCPQNQQAYDVIKMGFFHSLFNYLYIYLFSLFICLLILLKNKGLHKMGDLVPCFITRRNFSQRFQRYEEGQTPQARRSTNYPSTWLAASPLNFMLQLMKIILIFQPNDICVSKLHGFDPKFSEESFKAGLKLVGCAVKELWIFKLFHLIHLN